MKLYLITQTTNEDYDTYDSAVVCANSEREARMMQPNGHLYYSPGDDVETWSPPEDVKVSYLGEYFGGTNAAVICASFNAG